MKSVFITGATGFVGRHLVEYFLKQNIEVYALCRSKIKSKSIFGEGDQRLHIVEGDLKTLLDCIEQLHNPYVDVFYHIGWEGLWGTVRDDFQQQVKNIGYSGLAADAAKKLKCKKLVVTGTVYERMREYTLSCSHHVAFSLYYLSKNSAHELLSQYCISLGLPLVWCTFLQPIGSYMSPEQLTIQAVRTFLNGESMAFGKGNYPFDMIHIKDLVQALFLVGNQETALQEYYIGSGNPNLLSNYIKIIRDLIDSSIPLRLGERPEDGTFFNWSWFSIKNLVRDTGYQPQYSFEQAISELIKFEMDHMGS